MILAASELQKISSHITSLNNLDIRGACIDLSIGEIAKIRKPNTDLDLFEIDYSEKIGIQEDIYEEINLAKGFKLLPQSYLYARSAESVMIPDDMCALAIPRIIFSEIGLILPLSFYTHQPKNHHLPIILFNASNSKITIPPYIKIMQLVFMELKGKKIPKNNNTYTNPKFNHAEIEALLNGITKRQID